MSYFRGICCEDCLLIQGGLERCKEGIRLNIGDTIFSLYEHFLFFFAMAKFLIFSCWYWNNYEPKCSARKFLISYPRPFCSLEIMKFISNFTWNLPLHSVKFFKSWQNPKKLCSQAHPKFYISYTKVVIFFFERVCSIWSLLPFAK